MAFWWGCLKESDRLDDLDMEGEDTEIDLRVWTGLMWLRVEKSGMLL